MIGRIARMTPKRVANLRVDALVDSVGPTRRPEALFPDLDPQVIEQNASWLTPDYIEPHAGLLIMAYTSFLIRMPGRTILVDCAIGEDGTYPARPDWHRAKSNWLNHLGLAGTAPEDIDTVFLTHLHADHTGWLTRKTAVGWMPSFPQALHLTNEAELAYWPAHHRERPFMAESVPDSVAPVIERGLFRTIAAEEELAPGLFTVDLSGHSPGMMGLEYRKGDIVRAAFIADLMHHPLQIAAPHASTIFCSDPAKAARIRKRKLAQYAEEKTVLFCNHFPGECGGHVVIQSDGYRFVPAVQHDL